MGGFSFASVILSYFLVAGGTFLTTLVAARLGVHNEYIGYAIMAVGGFLGGLLAARASSGSTIIEPAIGSVVMVGSLVVLGLAVSDEPGRAIIMLPSNLKALFLTSAASAGGGIAGAMLSEKLFGKSTQSSAPWILYVAFAGFGAGVMGSIFGGVIAKEAGTFYGIVAIGCLLVGLATGASARSRPLLATLVGGTIGVGAFFYLAILIIVAVFSPMSHGADVPKEIYAGLAVVAVGAGLVTMIGALIGWLAVGKKQTPATLA